MAYSTKYRAEFNDLRGSDWKVDILQDAFSGTITNLQCKDNPLIIYFDNESDDAFDPIRATKAELTVYSLTNFVLNDLYATEDRHFQVNIYKDDVLYLTGWIEVGNYSEPYDMPPYPVTIAITDGLESLKDILYDDDGTAYDGRMLESQIILDILGKIGATTFTEFVNIYETDMDNGTGDSPMDQLYIDVDVFADMYCWDVLSELLKIYNAYIRQIDGVFCIIRPAELTGVTVYGRTFTAATTKSSTSITPQQLISRSTGATNILQVPGGAMMMEPPADKVTVRQDYGNKDSWLVNWQFEASKFTEVTPYIEFTCDAWSKSSAYLIQPSKQIKTSGSSDGVFLVMHNNYPTLTLYISQTFGTYLVATDNVCEFQLEYMLLNKSTSDEVDQKIYIEVKADNAAQYLQDSTTTSLAWNTSADYIEIIDDAPIGTDGWKTFRRTIPTLPVDGPYTIKIFALDDTNDEIYLGIKNVKIFSTADALVIRTHKIGALELLGTFRWGGKELYSWLDAWRSKKVIDQEEIIRFDYIEENAINGAERIYTTMLGDVIGSDIDNVLEQFAGSLAVGAPDTLTDVAARFVTDHAGDYSGGGVVVTSSGADIILTSDTAGVDFTGATSITNLTGNLDGTVETTQANAVAQKQLVNMYFTGTSGEGNVTAGGVTRAMFWNTSLAQTILDWVNAYETDYAAAGIKVTEGDNYIQFEALVAGTGFTGPTYVQLDPDLDESDLWVIQENVTAQARIDKITLSGSTGTANITCDSVTEEAEFESPTIAPSSEWNRRGNTDEKALLEIIAEEIASVYSRPKQLIQMPIIDKAAAMSIDLSGNFQDAVNVIGDFMRCFVANRAKFEVRPRRWEIDLFEIGQGATSGETGDVTADSTTTTVDDTTITIDSL